MGKILRNLFLVALAVCFGLPIIATFIKAWDQYEELFVSDSSYFDFLKNSLLYAMVNTVIGILLALPLGFVFAKIRFRFKEALFFVYVVVMMMPFQATMLPEYIILRDMKLLNTPAALMLPFWFSPIAVFLFRQFMKSIPDEILDSARLETDSLFVMMKSIIIPQVIPAIVTLFVLLFCESWNMVEQALIFSAQNQEILPLSVMLGELPEEIAFSGASVYMFPAVLLFFMAEKLLYRGMESYRW